MGKKCINDQANNRVVVSKRVGNILENWNLIFIEQTAQARRWFIFFITIPDEYFISILKFYTSSPSLTHCLTFFSSSYFFTCSPALSTSAIDDQCAVFFDDLSCFSNSIGKNSEISEWLRCCVVVASRRRVVHSKNEEITFRNINH